MIKKLIKFILISTTILIIIIFYLSFFGISTNKLNNKIKTEILNINKNINLELKSVKLLLNPFDFTINIKTFGSNILFDNNQIELENIITNISLKSLLNNQFSIDDLQISTKAINLKDLIRLARSFENSTELFILERIIKDGFLIGDIHLNFDSSGKVKDDYEIKGFIKNGKIDILKKNNLENLNLLFLIKDNNYLLEDVNLEFNQIKFLSPLIAIKKKNNQFLIDGILISNKKDRHDCKHEEHSTHICKSFATYFKKDARRSFLQRPSNNEHLICISLSLSLYIHIYIYIYIGPPSTTPRSDRDTEFAGLCIYLPLFLSLSLSTYIYIYIYRFNGAPTKQT